MNSPLEREFAQVRKMLDPATRPLWEGVGPKPEHHGLDALSSIERHVQDMEPLMRQMLDHLEFAYYPQTGDGPHLVDPFDLMESARAALPAREKEEE